MVAISDFDRNNNSDGLKPHLSTLCAERTKQVLTFECSQDQVISLFNMIMVLIFLGNAYGTTDFFKCYGHKSIMRSKSSRGSTKDEEEAQLLLLCPFFRDNKTITTTRSFVYLCENDLFSFFCGQWYLMSCFCYWDYTWMHSSYLCSQGPNCVPVYGRTDGLCMSDPCGENKLKFYCFSCCGFKMHCGRISFVSRLLIFLVKNSLFLMISFIN